MEDEKQEIASAAVSSHEVGEEEFFLDDDEGFTSEHLLDWTPSELHPHPPSTPRLQTLTRRQKIMSGGASFPECQDHQCLGCRRSCRTRLSSEFQLWCEFCQAEKTQLCKERGICISWDAQQTQLFRDTQTIHQASLQLLPTFQAQGAEAGEAEDVGSVEGAVRVPYPPPVPPAQHVPPTPEGRGPQPPVPVSVRPRLKTPHTTNSPAKEQEDTREAKEEKEKRVTFHQDATPTSSTMHPSIDSPNMEGGRGGYDQPSEPETRPQSSGRDDLTSQQYITGPYTSQEPAANRVLGAQALSPMSPQDPGGYNPLHQMFGRPTGPPISTRFSDAENRLRGDLSFGGPSRSAVGAEEVIQWDGEGLPHQRTRPPQRPPPAQHLTHREMWNQVRQPNVTEEESHLFGTPMSIATPHQVGSRWSQGNLEQDDTPRRPIVQPPRFLPKSSTPRQTPNDRVEQLPVEAALAQVYQQEAVGGGRTVPHMRTTTPTPTHAWETPLRDQQGSRQRRLMVGGELGDQEEGLWREGGEQMRAREENFRGTPTSPSHDQQIAKILEKLTDRLDRPGHARGFNSPSSLKMPALQLPTIRRSANNDVTARSYFQWKISLSTVISLHGVSPDAILIHYATTPKLLPEEFTTIMANSESLQEAIGSLDTLFPSLASVRPELIRGMTDLPPLVNATEKTRVFRITTLLRLLDEFLKFFGASPHRDLTRQDVLVILHNFFGSQESRAELVKEVTIMESAKRQGVMYAEGLKQYLSKTRTILVDVISALQLLGKVETSKHRSAAGRVNNEKKENENKMQGDVSTGGKNETRKVTCLLCSSNEHSTFGCLDQLKLIREGKKRLDTKRICSACLGPITTPHDQNCAIKRSFRDGVYLLTDFKCKKGCGVHNRLCNCQAGPQQQVDPDQTKRLRSAAMRARQVSEEAPATTRTTTTTTRDSQEPEVGEQQQVLSAANTAGEVDGPVIFQSENLRLLGRDGTTQEIVCSFDSHGSKHFLSGTLPENYLHSTEQSKTFQIDTVTGSQEARREVYNVKLLTLKGKLDLEVVQANWVAPGEEPQLGQEEAETYGVSIPCVEDAHGAPLPRLILSASELQLHPKEVPCPVGLKNLHPKLNLYRSRLSNQVLCGGQLGRGGYSSTQ